MWRAITALLLIGTEHASLPPAGDSLSEAVEVSCCAMGQAGQPAEGAGQPAAEAGAAPGVEIRGRVVIPSSWGFLKPELSQAVVYLESHADLDSAPGASEFATIGQQHKRFIPDFLVVAKGTIVEFPNWDDFDHNVFSRSEAAPAFDLDRYPKGQSKSRVFEKVGVVQVFCNIHPQMRATVVVTPNRYFATADEEGRFTLGAVPPGRYELVVWHARCAEHRETVEVKPEGVDLEITLRQQRANVLRDRARDGGYGVEAGLGIKRERLDLPVVEESHPARTKEPD